MKTISHLIVITTLFMCQNSMAATLVAVGDTYVYTQNPDTNYGSDTTFQVANDGGSPISKGKDRNALIKFDLSSLAEPVDFVELSFNADMGGRDYQLFAIPDGGADEDFDQNTLTFNTFAFSSTTLNGSLDTSGLVDLGTFSSISGEFTYSSPEMISFIQADTNDLVTFVVYGLTQDGNLESFSTIESVSGGSSLVISAVPEPATVSLLLGGVALMQIRRRKRHQRG